MGELRSVLGSKPDLPTPSSVVRVKLQDLAVCSYELKLATRSDKLQNLSAQHMETVFLIPPELGPCESAGSCVPHSYSGTQVLSVINMWLSCCPDILQLAEENGERKGECHTYSHKHRVPLTSP